MILALLAASLLSQAGPVPTGMSGKLGIGVFEDTGNTWTRDSQVPWTYRYRYLTYRWSQNWGSGPKDGAFAMRYFQECDAQGRIPAIAYYEIYDLPPASTGQLTKMRIPAAMREYFENVKILMNQAKAFGKPVLIVVEPDALGFMQGEVASNPNAYAAIAASGMPELGDVPDTVAGWSLAWLRLRAYLGASNVILGMVVSGWASGQDLFHSSTTVPLGPAVDSVANFLGPLGLTANSTGKTYDVLVADPLDRDADFYRLTRGEDRWWDANDAASVNSKSFVRYVEWLRLWNVKTSKRWVLWQIPIGNANSPNNGQAGYKDNRVEYILGTGNAHHRATLVKNGVVALLFGAGAGAQTTQQTDGNFLRDRARAYYAAGALDLGGTVTVPPPVVVDAGSCPVCPACPPRDICPICPVRDAGTPSVPDAGAVTPPTGFALTFMPLGDSLTSEAWSWRCQLQTLLKGVTTNPTFVGSQVDQYDACARNHEGHPGFTTVNLNSGLPGWLSTYRPNVVVLTIGTNDIAWWTAETGTAVADRINAMVGRMQSLSPGVRVVVATLPPMSSQNIAPNNVNRATLVQQLNARLRVVIAARVAAGERVRLADINAVVTLADLRDGIHPTQTAGVSKMAPAYYTAVRAVLAVP